MAYSRPAYDWTIMIYMASNDYYSDRAAQKFLKELNELGHEMKRHSKSGRVKILLQSFGNWNRHQRTGAYYSRLYEIRAGFLRNKRLTLDIVNVNMGDEHTLSDFIGRCKEGFPAKKYMLFLWGHGTGVGMYNYELKEAQSNVRHLNRFITAVTNQPEPINDEWDDRIMEKQVIHTKVKHPTVIFYFNVSKHNDLKQYLPDKIRLDSLTSKEIRESLRDNFRKPPGKVDIVCILGCAMQMVEFGYEIRKYCNYYVASEELMFWEGYNYKKTFFRLFRNPTMQAKELAEFLITDATKKSTYTKAEKRGIAISCVDLNRSGELARQIDGISKAILNKWEIIVDFVANARLRCYHFGEKSYDSYIDATWFFKCLCGQLKNRRAHRHIFNRAKAIVKFLEQDYILAKYIGTDRNIGKNAQTIGGHGVSIYMPYGKKDERNNDTRRFPFRKDSPFKVKFVNNEWNNLVFAFIDHIHGDPQKRNKKL
ncbi:MAG TPA: clostripain-related cysteine peptidase [Puia sp.]|nr:clostripain-related cysteine peptidase [Puia sp.]